MSTKDSDFKRKVEHAATIQLAASFLKVLQVMRAACFTDEDSKSAAKQMQVRRARDAMQKSTWTNDTLAINTVTVPSRCLPATDLSVSTLTSPSVPAGGEVANDHAVHMLNKMGYAGHLLVVKIEDNWEEAVPLTQPQLKEKIEVMRRATAHTKMFLATKGEHVMTDDFFVLTQTNINEFDIKQLTKEKKKWLKGTEVDAEA